MTQNDLKKLDKKLRAIPDPLGSGFLAVHALLKEVEDESGYPIGDIMRQYTAWKLKSML